MQWPNNIENSDADSPAHAGLSAINRLILPIRFPFATLSPKQFIMSTWKRKPQERQGTYRFSGTFYVTPTVMKKLSEEEIAAIYCQILALVLENDGLDYLQVFVNDKGDKLYFIDQCDPEMMAEPSFKEEYNYCTLLFSHEY